MLKVLVIFTIIALFTFEEVNSRGSRGGGSSRSSFRSGSYRSFRSVRSGSSFRSSSSRLYGSRVAVSSGIYGGSLYLGRSWRTRYGHSHFDNYISYEICYNDVESKPDDDLNSTDISNNSSSSVLGFFICPLDDDTYKRFCCGSDDMEYCCGYWDKPGNVAGVVVAIIILALFVLIVCCKLLFVCCSDKKPIQNPIVQEEAPPIPYSDNPDAIGTTSYAPPPGTAPPPDSESFPMIGFKDMPPPPYEEPADDKKKPFV